MDGTEEAVCRTLAAVNAPLHDIGILTDPGMFAKMDSLTDAQCMRRIPYLRSTHDGSSSCTTS